VASMTENRGAGVARRASLLAGQNWGRNGQKKHRGDCAKAQVSALLREQYFRLRRKSWNLEGRGKDEKKRETVAGHDTEAPDQGDQ